MQKKTKYCNSLVSKVLPTINEIGDNNLIFNQIDNSLCFAMWKVIFFSTPASLATFFRYRFATWLGGTGNT